MKNDNGSIQNYIKHETKRTVLTRFLIILSIFIIYLAFLISRDGGREGLLTTLFTWSIFVLCTPIADAGFLIDFPVRLFTRIRMVYSESIVWCVAILLNIFGFFLFPSVYNKTGLLKLFKLILTNPFPYWLIIILSAMGTFLSIYFGAELMDVSLHKKRKKHRKHKHKHLIITIIFLIVSIMLLYYHLIYRWGISF